MNKLNYHRLSAVLLSNESDVEMTGPTTDETIIYMQEIICFLTVDSLVIILPVRHFCTVDCGKKVEKRYFFIIFRQTTSKVPCKVKVCDLLIVYYSFFWNHVYNEWKYIFPSLFSFSLSSCSHSKIFLGVWARKKVSFKLPAVCPYSTSKY